MLWMTFALLASALVLMACSLALELGTGTVLLCRFSVLLCRFSISETDSNNPRTVVLQGKLDEGHEGAANSLPYGKQAAQQGNGADTDPYNSDAPSIESADPETPEDKSETALFLANSKVEHMDPHLRGKMVVFTHVHKAGGSTFCYLARLNMEQTPGGNCNPAPTLSRLAISRGTPEEFDRVIAETRELNRTFVATEWTLPEVLPQRDDIVHVTLLRNPLGRMESHYAMAMGKAYQKLKESRKNSCLFAPGLLSRFEIHLTLAAKSRLYYSQTTPDNWQTRVFCGPLCARIPYGQLTREHLELAKNRLQSTYAAVGILDNFRQTVLLMHETLQWETDPEKLFAKHKGTNHGGLTVLQRVEQESAKQPELLEFAKWFHATNLLDIELYNFARGIFKRQLQYFGIPAEIGPDVSLDFVSPNQKVTTAAELKAMVDEYAVSCSTQCCTKQTWRLASCAATVALSVLVAVALFTRFVGLEHLVSGQGALDAHDEDNNFANNAETLLVANRERDPAERGVFKRKFVAVFLHIHKSGGTTMCYLACKRERAVRDTNCNMYGGEERIKFSNGSPDEFAGLIDKYHKDKRRRLTFLASEWYLPAQLPERNDIKYMTMLRDPLARMESHFHMAFEQVLKLVKNSPGTFASRRRHYSDGMPSWQDLRRVSKSTNSASSIRLYFALNVPDNWQTRAVCGPACAKVPFGRLTDEHYEIARYRLEHDFAVVGILEHFETSITLIHDLLQWRGNSSDEFREHHGTNHGGLSALARLEENTAGDPQLLDFAKWWHAVNLYDIRLYNVGRNILQRQAAAAGLKVDMGPDAAQEFVSPDGSVMSEDDLRAMLDANVDTRN
ncbi:Hypothetical Protein FCC1311_017402 [Hondaea fermentalgiana]|uniref:Uncharacterized protein n=1 Tax=Hondaea fermentalgiana TaxID=2315210 RepID=A0A2R5GBL7_9STRA|nr:Hypothetical Protein FCC1311_017402 [Hondaea fermentalgiana]|eukprot:GBG25521.1 Hypothetical Protein FCC1311_017402 [Hondaea fermentalgiana]